jgi:hypothetical protein
MTRIKLSTIKLFFSTALLLISCVCLAHPLPDEIQPYDIVILKSDHFTIRYPRNTELYARKTIDYAEHVYDILSQKLGSSVEQITIQLYDRADIYLDYPSADFGDNFTIYLWPPESIFEYPYYGKWLEEQIASHIARILVQRTGSDFFHKYSNLVLPLWYLDGIANLYTFPNNPGLPRHHGLIRAIVRTAARNHTLPELGFLMSDAPTWLGQSINEIYGSAFLNDIAKQYGFEKLSEWNQLNGSNFSSIDHNAETIFGKSWSELYQDWTEKLQNSQLPDDIPQNDISESYLNEYPQIIPGKNAISYVRDDGLRPRTIVSHDLDTQQETAIVECKGQCEHHWSKNGSILYYTTLIKTSHYEAKTLYALDSGKHIPRKLPIPGHIRTFTENNGIIAAVTILNNQPQIYVLDTESNEDAEVIYTAPPFSLIEGITAIAHHQWLFSFYDPEKKQFDLIELRDNRDSIDIRSITDSPETEMYPFVMQDNSIGYITENDGYYDLNRISLDGSNHQILYRHDAVMIQPVQSSDDKIYYTDIRDKGMAIAVLHPQQWLDEPPQEHIPADQPSEDASSAQPIPHIDATFEDGFDWSVFIPDTYLPDLGISDPSGWYLGIYLENSDDLNHHLYHTYFAWHFGSNVFDLDIGYRYHQYRWWISAEIAVEQETYLVDTGKDYLRFPLTTYWASLKTGTDYHSPLLDLDISFELLAEHTKTNDHSMEDIFRQWAEKLDDKDIDLNQRWTNAAIANIKLSHFHDAPRTIPGKTGYSLDYMLRFEPPFFGNYTYALINQLKLEMSWPMIWRMVDVLSLSVKYGLAITGKPYRYPLEEDTASGFDFNYFSLTELTAFHGIRSGNLLANNHLIHTHLSYTLPVVEFQNNSLEVPFMLNRIGLGFVGDWAVKSDQIDRIDFSSSMFGTGCELYLDMTALYRFPLKLKFGYERGFAKAGENAYYLWIGFL